ncbi:hypothetical protein ACFOET_01845 [Parapedobacter deserti]|uniref:Outer membrane protein beta-barrel domain-containing protein n=1 Tax=Parapedobacter deserti TaxID=1912957 RepID=A0ABV7JHY6_9SPHI
MKTCVIGALLVLIRFLLFAQEEPDPNHRLSVGLLGHYHATNYRLGLSGHLKWLLPSSHAGGNRFLFTAKATHSEPKNGPFFSAFDNGKYDNISTVYLMVGHRINLFDKGWRASASTPVGNHSAYLELNGGSGYNGLHRRFGFALNPVMGYSFDQRFDINFGYQSLLVGTDYPNLHYLEVGLAYQF